MSMVSNTRPWSLVVLLLIPVLLLSGLAEARAERRVALVVGVSHYDTLSDLPNARRDAEVLWRTLRDGALGFDVGVAPLVDPTKQELEVALRSFRERAAGVEVALIFYAGHGLSINGRPYLTGSDQPLARLEEVSEVASAVFASAMARGAVDAELFVDALQAREVNLLILDAWRYEPRVEDLERRTNLSASLALAPVLSQGVTAVPARTPGGVLVAYSTAEGRTAWDGPPGANSPYTTALVSALSDPQARGDDVRLFFDEVSGSVQEATDEWQHPWYYVSPGHWRFSFGRGRPPPPPPPDETQLVLGVYPLAGSGESFRDCPECPEMVVIPAGSFTMGSPASEVGRWDDEGPPVSVTIGRSFAVGKHPVTRGEYGAFVRATGRADPRSCRTYEGVSWADRPGRGWRSPGFSQDDRHPVVCVSWEDAQAYVGWLSSRTGKGYRLLSESEWEYAARAGTRTARWWGEDANQACAHANVADQAARRQYPGLTVHACDDGWVHTAPVGSYRANGFGLHDTLGNVWEWTGDCWNESHAGALSDGRARRSGDCGRRVLRGGSWYVNPRDLRAAVRSRNISGLHYNYAGFRVTRTLD